MGNSHVKDLETEFLRVQNQILIKSVRNLSVAPHILRQIELTRQTGQYHYLVLLADAFHGIAHIGFLEKLDEKAYLNNIKGIACSSFSSIIGAFMTLGYAPKDIRTILMKEDLSCLINGKDGLISKYYKVLPNHGSSAGGTLVTFLGNVINKRTGNPDYTFGDLWRDRKMDLIITATDLVNKNIVYFCREYTPDLPIRHAIRMSIGIPYVLQPIIYQERFLVDGSIIPCPITIFDGDFPEDPRTLPPNPRTLIIQVTGSLLELSDELDLSNDTHYAMALLQAKQVSLDERSTQDLLRTVYIPVPRRLLQWIPTKDEMEVLFNIAGFRPV